jgi:hypothetical protein
VAALSEPLSSYLSLPLKNAATAKAAEAEAEAAAAVQCQDTALIITDRGRSSNNSSRASAKVAGLAMQMTRQDEQQTAAGSKE